MGNAKSKPKKCYLQGCAKNEVARTEAEQYADLWTDVYAATYAVWKVGSRKKRVGMYMTFECLKEHFETCPPSVKETKEMTKKGYKRITYRLISQYVVDDQDNAELKDVTPMGGATLWIPVVEIRWSTWSNHAECHREAPPLSFKISMMRELIDKSYSMLNKTEQAAARLWAKYTREGRSFDFEDCYMIARADNEGTLAGFLDEKGGIECEFPFSGVLDAMAGDEWGSVSGDKIRRCEAAAQDYRDKYGTKRPDKQPCRSWNLDP